MESHGQFPIRAVQNRGHRDWLLDTYTIGGVKSDPYDTSGELIVCGCKSIRVSICDTFFWHVMANPSFWRVRKRGTKGNRRRGRQIECVGDLGSKGQGGRVS